MSLLNLHPPFCLFLLVIGLYFLCGLVFVDTPICLLTHLGIFTPFCVPSLSLFILLMLFIFFLITTPDQLFNLSLYVLISALVLSPIFSNLPSPFSPFPFCHVHLLLFFPSIFRLSFDYNFSFFSLLLLSIPTDTLFLLLCFFYLLCVVPQILILNPPSPVLTFF